MFVIDAHEDIAWNALALGRDYTGSALSIRQREADQAYVRQTGSAMLGTTEWLIGRVAIIFSTIFLTPQRHNFVAWNTQSYGDAAEAHRLAQAQMDYYHRLVEEKPLFEMVGTRADLESVLSTWVEGKSIKDRRIGLIPLMEGADPIREPEEVEMWFERGLRVLGPAWASTRYAGGAHEPGPFTSEGFALLEKMAEYSFILDLSHLAEQAFFQALERYEGNVVATHANPRRFVNTPRSLSDEMIAALAQRGGVIGVIPFNRFLREGWRKGDSKRGITAHTLIDAIDHICQVTGSANHVALGSDFDGLFGAEHTPEGFDTVADLITLAHPLRERGFSEAQVQAILNGNWLRVLREGLPE